MSYPNPYGINVGNLSDSQRRALAESVVGASPTVTTDEEDLLDDDTWTLRRSLQATQEEYEEEIEYILSVYEQAEKGELVPLEDVLPDHSQVN